MQESFVGVLEEVLICPYYSMNVVTVLINRGTQNTLRYVIIIQGIYCLAYMYMYRYMCTC